MCIIDLCGYVDGKCNKYVYEGCSYYMDDVVVDKFEE